MKSQPEVKNRKTGRSDSRISVGRKADSRRRYAAKPLAVLLIAVMLLSAVPLVSGSDDTAGASGDTTDVVYHMYKPGEKPGVKAGFNESTTSDDSNPSITVRYCGVASTAYNPQKWNGTIKGKIISGNDSNWFPITNYSVGDTVVFTGWVYQLGTGTETTYSSLEKTGYFPGRVLNDPSLYSLIDGKIHVYATWGVLKNYTVANGSDLNNSTISSWNGDGNAFTNILELKDTPYTLKGEFSKPLTVTGKGESTSVTVSNQVLLLNNCIIDNLSIRNSVQTNGNHGDGNNVGLYAQGNKLVLGTGLTASLSQNEANGTIPERYLLQVIGGSSNSTVAGTNVIVHSGFYSNIVAGGQGDNGGINGDANLTIRGGTILDTVVGGCSDGKGVVTGDTYVYLIGKAVMPGDYYEEHSLDGNYRLLIGSEIKLKESTILTGGSNNGQINGDTFVYISGDATAWDVQGAGRRGQSTVSGTANVYVSGNAIVKHAVNGSITDGLDGDTGHGSPSNNKSNQCVKNTHIVISDNAKVASVFGAGYDTFYASNYSSMFNGGTILIEIKGGTVGYIYGGGYRGSIGIESNESTTASPLESITIDITGGKVLHDVFGGGRGGLDKVCHNSDGTINWGTSQNDTVGHSKVYVRNLTISIGEKATIGGNVYGGGESTPIITNYDGVEKPYNNQALGGSNDAKVASVDCDNLVMKIHGTVKGNVYGAGKGIDSNDLSGGRHSSAYIFALDPDGGIASIPWFSGGTASTTISGYMDEFASMTAGTVSITVGTGAQIQHSVYGGGALGSLTGRTSNNGLSIHVSLAGTADVQGSVYGGGMGSNTDENAGRIDTDSILVDIQSGTVTQNVYGGGALGRTVAKNIKVIVGNDDPSTQTKVFGSVYGGGMGLLGNSDAGNVTSDISVIVKSDALIGGSVYGGGELAQTVGNIDVEIHAVISGNVFGGGLGAQKSVSTNGSKRTVKVGKGARIGGSVFGSSSLGDDASGTSGVTITGGDIEGSVFGGGLKGTTDGSTCIEVFSDDDIRIKGSIYGGADIGDNNDAMIGAVLVKGDSSVTVEKRNGNLIFEGSIFGSGNSCLVSGTKTVSVKGVTDTTMQSFQNITDLKIESSDITLVGRTSGESSQVSTIHSIRNIHNLTLVAGTALELRVSAVNIGSLTSCVSDGIPSDVSAPSNKIVICDGHIASVFYNDAYGLVTGYTVVQTDVNTENDGIYIYGSTKSAGGFVTIENGIFEKMDAVDFDLPDHNSGEYRCWFMKGGITQTASIIADGQTKGNETTSTKTGSLAIPRMSTSSKLLFHGYEVRIYNHNAFNLVGEFEDNPNQYRIGIGSFRSVVDGTTVGSLPLHSGITHASGTFALVGDRLEYTLTTSSQITYIGKVAEITVLFWESSSSNAPMNPVYLKIAIHAQSPGISSEYQSTIDIQGGSGNTNIVINKGHGGAKIWVEKVDWKDMTPVDGITITPKINDENTEGWVTPLADSLNLSSFNERYLLGELSGSFSATLLLSASGLSDIPSGTVEVKVVVQFEDNTEKEVTLRLEFKATETCEVQFVYWLFSVSNGKTTWVQKTDSIQAYQGDVIPTDSIPQPGYFTGWYPDTGYRVPFDLNAPIHGTKSGNGTGNVLTVYARQGFMATFDNGDGTQENPFVPFAMKADDTFDLDDGRLYGILKSPGTPARDNYTFKCWADNSGKEWFTGTTTEERIHSDMKFVAEWYGKEIEITFQIVHENNTTEFKGTLHFGDVYSQVQIHDTQVDSWEKVTAKAKELGGNAQTFIRWVYGNEPVFGDNITKTSESHTLKAEFTDNAIEVVFDNTTVPYDFGKDKDYNYNATPIVHAPQKMVVFEENDVYAFAPVNIDFKGYHLRYWTDSPNDAQNSNHYYVGKRYEITQETAGTLSDKRLTLYPVFEHQRYNLIVDQTMSGRIEAHPVNGTFNGYDLSNGGTVHYMDKIKLSYGESACTWNIKGNGELVTENGETFLIVHGDCRVYILYTAFRLNLLIDGVVAPDTTRLVLKNGTEEYELKHVGNGTFEAGSLRGNYTLQIQTGSGWLDIERFIGIENYKDPTLELYSLNGDRDHFEFPEYAKSGSTVMVASKGNHGGEITVDRETLIVWDQSTFEIHGRAQIKFAFVIKIVDFTDGIRVDGAKKIDASTYIAESTSVALGYDVGITKWKVLGWWASDGKSAFEKIEKPGNVTADKNILIRPVFELDSPSSETKDLGTFVYTLEKSATGTYADLTPVSGTPTGEFTRIFSDYGDVTIALNNGKMTVEGLANATGTVYFPDLEYESGGTRYRASFIFYIVSDVSPADGLFTLIRETKTTSLGS